MIIFDITINELLHNLFHKFPLAENFLTLNRR